MARSGRLRLWFRIAAVLLFFLLLGSVTVICQTPNASGSQQPVPDAPSAKRPFPKPTVPPVPETGNEVPEAPTPQLGTAPGGEGGVPPAPEITTVPPGSASTAPDPNSRSALEFTLKREVNFVLVPVTVKDTSGHLVAGLLNKDFTIYEDGKLQKTTFFTSDPFPLSAAVVLDLGMPDTVVKKVNDTLPALVGAFGQFDEVGLFTYGDTVRMVQDFIPAAGNQVGNVFRKVQKTASSKQSGPFGMAGPLGSGPSINGHPADPGGSATVNSSQSGTIYRPEARVLNDAVLAAALDLAKRPRTNRKIIFIISDGRELRSAASYSDVLKVLLSNEITVYAVGVGNLGIPPYRELQKIRIPGQGYGDILPRYARATGGQVFSEYSQDAIEAVYSRGTEEARNQYTLGYTTPATPSSTYREIEVRVRRPNLKVTAKGGYYPLPPSR